MCAGNLWSPEIPPALFRIPAERRRRGLELNRRMILQTIRRAIQSEARADGERGTTRGQKNFGLSMLWMDALAKNAVGRYADEILALAIEHEARRF